MDQGLICLLTLKSINHIVIERACRPTLSQPDLALNLEICDLINEKQGALPRHAAVVCVKLVNSKDPQVSELAIQLLDILVKNCGYPFHLQISRKEFLNELVKRFPERPPPRYSRSQRLILGLIEEWTQTLCKTSRYKLDLGFIRDMRRLLDHKGYIFPELKKEDAAVLNPSDNLKSIEEIQKEEKIAQSAKLQELIRRGRPQDLKEANKLMKIMSGFKDEEQLEQTKLKVAEDINKLKRKVEIFTDMIGNASNTGQIDANDSTINDLYYALKVAQPKIQKIIEEESDDADTVTDLLHLNDQINTLINQYIALKGGDPMASSTTTSALNLIDFGDDDDNESPAPSGPASSKPLSSGDDLVDLLGDLNFSSNGGSSQQPLFGLGGSIALESSPPPLTDSLLGSPTNTQFGGLINALPQPPLPQLPQLDPFQFDFNSMSSPPPQLQLTSSNNKILVNQSSHLRFEFEKISQNDSKIALKSLFSNLSTSPVTSLQIMLAVPKSWDLQLLPQSGNYIAPLTNDGVSQFINLTKRSESNKLPKIKWKIDFVINGANFEENGVVQI